MPLRPRWKTECDRLAKVSIAFAHAALRETIFKESIQLMTQSRALMDANKPSEPPPKDPILD
eukprot:80911-Pleurochrysis_carterae.AAC.1